MASLYELTDSYVQLQQVIEDGNDENLEAILKTINDEIEIKAENYAKVMRNMDGDIAAIDSEIERLQNKKKVLQNGIDRMKQSLYNSMKEIGKEKFKTELFSFTIAKNGGKTPVVIEDEGQVPMEYQVASYSVDKNKIREELESGKELSFAKLGQKGESLRIR